jgi:hypothetical protein
VPETFGQEPSESFTGVQNLDNKAIEDRQGIMAGADLPTAIGPPDGSTQQEGRRGKGREVILEKFKMANPTGDKVIVDHPSTFAQSLDEEIES